MTPLMAPLMVPLMAPIMSRWPSCTTAPVRCADGRLPMSRACPRGRAMGPCAFWMSAPQRPAGPWARRAAPKRSSRSAKREG